MPVAAVFCLAKMPGLIIGTAIARAKITTAKIATAMCGIALATIEMTIIRKGSRLFRSHAYVDVYDTLIRNAMRDFDTIAVDKVGTQLDIAINRWTRRSIDINYL